MTTPRYTADELTEMAEALEMRRVKVGDRLLSEVNAVRQAAETARALEGFRAWLENDDPELEAGWSETLDEFRRRFGRTP